MKSLTEYITEGYWGCGLFQNDYVLDKQDKLFEEFINKAIDNCKKSTSEEDLFYNISILVDLLKRLDNSEEANSYKSKDDLKQFILDSIDKINQHFDGQWNKEQTNKEWPKTIKQLTDMTNNFFKK